jgi:YesN/AraC family two-component response regulator
MLELKSRLAGLQAIILSGYADPEFEEEALHLGAFAYLRKPCRLAEIEATIERALGEPLGARGETV